MRKLMILLLCLALTAAFAACASEATPAATTETTAATTEATQATTEAVTEPEETEPEETQPEETEPVLEATSLYGIDVSGMTREEAKTAITKALEEYSLRLSAQGQLFTFSAKELSMALSEEDFNTWFDSTSQGVETSTQGMITYNLSAALNTVHGRFAVAPVNATAVYNAAAGEFEVKSHQEGVSADISQVKSAMTTAVATLSPTASAAVSTEVEPAGITDEDARVKAAAQEANGYLHLSLTYVYEAEGIETSEQTISKDDLASFLTVDKALNVKIDADAIEAYIQKVSYENGGTERRPFVTTYGSTIGYEVDYYLAVLDVNALRQSITENVQNKNSGKFTAPFLSNETVNLAYGGNYVEIDLNNQCMWVYRNGQVVVSTPLVSGNVSTGAWTPPGVFSITYKTRSTYLVGAGYRSYVDYWMPFNGGIGLHDANWRTEFGGNIYMYDGSHGCVNLPPAMAGQVYDNISQGTKVIVYGGMSTVDKLTQSFTGTDAYTLTMDSAPLTLKVYPKYTGTTQHYTTSDTSVVMVDDQGVVTVVGPGEAVITVTSEPLGALESGTFEIRITVLGDGGTEPSEPEGGEGTEPSEPEGGEGTEPSEPENGENTDPSVPENGENTDPSEPESGENTDPSEPETEE